MAKLKVWKFFSVWMVFVLVVGLGVVIVPASPVTAGVAATIEVSQPVQATNNAYYERGQSIVYDGTNYWLFYGRSATCQVPYSGGNPDINDYVVYYKKAATVAGLAAATPTLISGVIHNSNGYLGETGAAYFGGEVWAFATIDNSTNADLYGWWTDDGGTTWNEVSIITGLSKGQAHHDEVAFNGELWVIEGSGDFTTMHSAIPKTGTWSDAPLSVGTLTGGLAHFFVDGTDLYLAINASTVNYIYKYNSTTVAWDLVDSNVPPNPYDPTLFKVDSNYVFAQAPWDGTKQYILACSGATLDSNFFDTGYKMVTEGAYGSNPWVDMWPIGFTDQSGDSYLFFTSERNPSDTSAEIVGNIWYLKYDWDVTRDHYTYIQEAIDAANPGDTINVAAGTYVEAITINKPLTLRGATYNVNKNGYTVPAGYAWDETVESIIKHPNPTSDYMAIVDIVDTDEVTFEGFVVQELSAVGNKNSSLVRVYAHTKEISDIVVGNNVIGPNTNTTSQDGAQGRMGLYIVNHPYSDNGVVNSTFSGNKIFDCKGNGNNVFIWSSYKNYGAPGPASMAGTVIEDNEIYGAHRSGIETAGGFSGLTIQNNKIYGNGGPAIVGKPELMFGNGILMIRGSGDRDNIEGYGPVDVTIEGNEIYDNDGHGIYMGPNNAGITITRNSLYNNGEDAIMVDLIGNYWNPDFETDPGPHTNLGGSQNIAAHLNNIYDNVGYGVQVIGTPTNGFVLNATSNWWGHASGPTHASNPGGSGDVISDNVKYSPWLGATQQTTPRTFYVNTTGTIQEAIDAASAGDTINVAVGTYDESVTINKNNLTLFGQVASQPAITGGLKLDTDLTGLTLQNFYVSGTAANDSIVRMYGVITDLFIDKCVFDGENIAGRMGFTGGRIEGDLTVTNSEFKDILDWAVFDTRSGSGGDGSAMGTVTFAHNNVHDCNGSIVFRGLSTDWTDNVYIYGNIFQDIGEAGVSDHWAAFEVNRANNVEIYDNEIRNVVECSWGEGQAMQLWQVGTVDIYANTVENNYMGIAFLKWPTAETYDVSGISIHDNNFFGNNQYALSVEGGLTGGLLSAENNWWGANDGPSGVGTGSGDVVSANVDYDPWLVLNISADPTSIVVGSVATSVITADMTRNSDDVDTSAQGHIPDGTQITFTTDKGSIGSLTVDKTTTNGIATATLTSSNTVETATVTASAPPHTVAATVSTTVEFVSQHTESATGTGTVTFAVDAGWITGLIAVAEVTLPTAGKPAGVTFLHGLFSFNITGIALGSTVTVTITYPSAMPVGTQYWKCQGGVWVDCTSLLGDDDGDNVLTLTLTDGGLGDADGPNGTIVDPGGPAVIAGGGVWGGGGGGGGLLATSACSLTLTANMQGNTATVSMTKDGVLCATCVAKDAAGKYRLEIDKDAKVMLAGNVVPLLLRFREASTTPPAPENTVIVGRVYEFNAYSSASATTPSPITISPPARLILTYDPDELPKNASEVFIAYHDTEKGWLELSPVPGVVAEIDKAYGMVSHFTPFAVLAKVTEPAPAKFNVGSLTVTPSKARLNQKVDISVSVANNGGTSGSYNLELKVNGISESTKQVTVAAGESQTVNFTITKAQPGTYTVDIAGQRGSFVVMGAGTALNGGLIAIVIAGVLILATVVVLLVSFRRRVY